jgi:predicted transposase YbfD/YdcC
MPHAQSIICTQTEVLDEDGRETQTRYWISSLPPETGAKRFGELARGHWNIENGSHRQRDVLWREDHQRFKTHRRAHVMATLRQSILCLHSREAQKRQERSGRVSRISHQARLFNYDLDAAIALLIGQR